MDKQILKVEVRKVTGRKVKNLRNEGVLPGNIYGKKVKSLSVQVPLKDFEKVYKEVGETGLVTLVIGKEERLLDDAVHAMEKFVREEEKAPSKELEEMWRDRGLLEWNLFKKKIFGGGLFHHFHAHHQIPDRAVLKEHKQTKHLLEHMK